MIGGDRPDTLVYLALPPGPSPVGPASFRGARVEAQSAVATPQAEAMRSQTVRARYTAGTIGTRQVPS